MKNDLTVLFYLKKSEAAAGEYPLMGRIKVGASKVYFSCKFSVSEKLWGSGKAAGKSAEAAAINQKLDRIRYLIAGSYEELSAMSDCVTAEQVKVRFQGMSSERPGLVKYFEDFITEFSKRVGVNREPSTLRTYKNALSSLRSFLKHKYKLSEISFPSLNLAFIEAFDLYLKVERRHKQGTVIIYTNKLRQMVKLAQNEGLLAYYPFIGYVAEAAEQTRRYLTGEELEKIRTTPLDHPYRYLVRDMFIFACYTGFAYREMCDLRPEELVEEDGMLWLKTDRHKTGNPENVPLLDIPIALIGKYRSIAPAGKLLPMLNNGDTNAHLRKIAELCGIDRRIVFHMARHTYASEITLSQGVSIESVSRMLGHRDLRSTRIYARITPEKIGVDMDNLQSRLAREFNL